MNRNVTGAGEKKWKSSKVTDVMGAERFLLPFGDHCLCLVGHGNKVFGWCVCYVAEMEYFIFGMLYKSGKSKIKKCANIIIEKNISCDGDVRRWAPAEDITAADTAPRPKKETKLKTKIYEHLHQITMKCWINTLERRWEHWQKDQNGIWSKWQHRFDDNMVSVDDWSPRGEVLKHHWQDHPCVVLEKKIEITFVHPYWCSGIKKSYFLYCQLMLKSFLFIANTIQPLVLAASYCAAKSSQFHSTL